MTRAARHEDTTYSLYPKTGGDRGFKTETGYTDYGERRLWRSTEGWVETPHGFVRAYSGFCERSYSHSSLEIISNGKSYYRRFDKELTARGLVTKAKQFAEEVFCGEIS